MKSSKKKTKLYRKTLGIIFLVYSLMIGSLIGFTFGLPNSSLKTSSQSILIYTQYADTNNELKFTKDAINASFGECIYEDLADYTNLSTQLPGHNIFLIPEQDFGNTDLMTTIGLNWSTSLTNFVNDGGVVILCDYTGFSYQIFNSSGLLGIDGCNETDHHGNTLDVVAPNDPLTEDVYPTFIAPTSTMSFNTNEGTSVVEYNSSSVVIHKTMGKGHLVLLGFDYFEFNSDTSKIIGNAVVLGVNPSSGIPGYYLYIFISISFVMVGITLLIVKKKLLYKS